jgi:hypothetical protein
VGKTGITLESLLRFSSNTSLKHVELEFSTVKDQFILLTDHTHGNNRCMSVNRPRVVICLNQSLQSVRFEVFTAVTMKNGVFWDVTPCGSCKNRLSASFIRVTIIGKLGTTLAVTSNRRFLHSVRRLLVTASAVPSSTILIALMNEAISYS